MISLKRIYMTVFLVVLAAVIGSVALTSWYTVDQSEQAVILTFGKVEEGISEPGLHFKMPWPIQDVKKLSKETFSLQFGYEERNGEVVEYTNDTKMITGDENIVLADMVVMWKISEPGKYLFNSDDPQAVLYNATSASLRSIIGSTQIDEALTSGKAQIEVEVFDLLTTLMETYDIGISVTSVNLQDVELPNAEVRKAFTDVTDAREMENTKNNEAKRYQNQRMNEAEGEKDAIISKAEGEKAARIERARGDVAKFNSLYNEYVNAPELTKKRLILETMEEVLPYAEIYIMNDDGNTMKYFPLRTENPAPKPPANPEGSGNNE
ncbi:FtsH protease activity modulator HflK [Sutcliffiella horikoshii]|uniref:FtsH protease activity modulator HflK n=1 Tax=Sutcliffiella horikoshii TaxID=79883 RepID=UPI001EED4232|nr:FtsH protease activity modulator HflK [Sutcliffiella horikoshii]MCG1022081.1 FtsH protease activity modulator HflK [Sutcliffiella horikoshii]